MSNQYLEELKNPSDAARGWTRWWWYGCAVKKDEIAYQLDEMERQNIGGIEVQILYPVAADDKENDRRNIEYFSPEFFEIIKFTAEEAKKRNMIFDFTLGSSWPYGGPFVTYDMSAPIVYPYYIDVTGPTKFSYDFTTKIAGDIVGCVMGRMEHSEMIPETIVDLNEKIGVKKLFNWPWGMTLEEIEIPEGDYKIVCFVSGKYRQHVLAPTRGAEGYVIDHNRKDAARLFFEHGGNPLVEKLGKGIISSFFCDSIEVGGHNWTNIMYDEFEKRRGYSLKPYIYALYGNIKGMTERIRYDYQKTFAELTVENFFEEMTKWCAEVGSKSRIQAHGTWGDVLKAYGAADIPEGETFYDFDHYTVNTIHRRLASSAGNVYNKPVISNESYTWLRFPRYMVTLEQMKVATDTIFIDGMNQIVNHGFTYNPTDGEEWPFYASSHICNTNTWWEFYKNMADYIQRVSHFMQKGKTKAEVAIYLPQNDIWAEHEMSDLHMCMKLKDRFEEDVIDGIAKAGYWFDYVNDDVLERHTEYEYQVLILMETKRLPVKTAQAILEFAKAGNLVIIAQEVPKISCGFIGADENDKAVVSAMESLQREETYRFAIDKRESLIQVLKDNFVPDLQISKGKEYIGYIHKVEGKKDIYFITNTAKESYETTLTFKGITAPYTIMDPFTTNEKGVLFDSVIEGSRELLLRLEPLQSCIVVFDEELEECTTIEKAEELVSSMDISKDWKFTGNGKVLLLENLIGFEKLEDMKYFSGTVKYEKVIEVVKTKDSYILSLEQVSECARVFVNGTLVGDIIKRPYTIDITNYLVEGKNTIRIEVANLLINRMIDPELETPLYEDVVIDEWPYFTNYMNFVREKRISNWREKDMVKEPVPSGIIGEVQIKVIKN